MTQESGSVEKPQQLTTRLNPLLTQELGSKAGIRGFQEVRTPRESRSSHNTTVQLKQVFGPCEAGAGVRISPPPTLGQVGLLEVITSIFASLWTLARKTFNSLCSWSQSAEFPRSWKEGLPRSFTDRGACLLGTGFLWLQHPPEGAQGESSRKDS